MSLHPRTGEARMFINTSASPIEGGKDDYKYLGFPLSNR